MLAFVDLEASALVSGYPIEIGWAREDGIVGAVLIRPHGEWLVDLTWDPNAQSIHLLPRELPLTGGTPIDDVVDTLNIALAGCRCISDAPAHDWRWLSLLLEFYDRGPREFTFDLLADPAEPLLLGLAEGLGTPPERIREILRATGTRHAHTAAGDVAAWATAHEAITTGGDVSQILPRWRERARTAMPWRSSKTAPFEEIAAEQFAKYDDALRTLANEWALPKQRD